MVWGGRRLGEILGKHLAASEAYGEAWNVSDHPLHRSVAASGPWKGRTLRDLMEHDRAHLLGPAAGQHTTFPWLVKFLDCNDWLSVQVHPDEEKVKTLWPGEGSKTEAWFVLSTAPGSRIYAGLLPGVDESKLRAALQAGTVAECLHHFEPQPGDCVFLRAGTVHAVGGGVLMAEVQQTSDATFRLFDWNRRDAQGKRRQLHIEEALASIHWDYGPVQPVKAAGFGDTSVKGAVQRQPLVHCPYFHLDYVQSGEPFPMGGEGKLQTLVVLQGKGRLATGDAEDAVAAGQVWVVPASVLKGLCRPDPALKLLLTTLP
jgi:mannose-6-phosphate isomerase